MFIIHVKTLQMRVGSNRAFGLYRLECCVYLKICLQLLLQGGMLPLHLLERPAASEVRQGMVKQVSTLQKNEMLI